MSWNLGDIFDAVAGAVPPDAPALLHGDRKVTWSQLDQRSNSLARQLQARGARPDDKVAFYMRNRPEYMELLLACFKARLVHANINFRYVSDEIHYILDNSDARFVVFAGEFGELVTKLRDRLPKVVGYVQIDDGSPRVPFAEAYEELVEEAASGPLDVERSPDDLLLLYTGGTTGMPKGVMWRSDDLWEALGRGANATNGNTASETLEEHTERIRSQGPAARHLSACPLMHGTGLFTSIGALANGGTIVTLESPRLDADELWRAVERHKVNSCAIVGDAFAKPMLRALDEKPGAYDLSSMVYIISSGVMFSTEVKKGLLKHHPGMVLADSFGSSEAVGFGMSVTTAQGETRTARFQIGERVKVFTEEGREVKPGTGEAGLVARGGPIPLGYYKDAEKTASTFKVIDGVRYSIPGDYCRVEEDGTLTLLGRGSVCINTGGEKVYPEEVEEALKEHVDVDDAVVVGLPDEKWGQAIVGVVQLRPGAAAFDEEQLRQHVKDRLAAYKCPKRVLAVDTTDRAPNGKADYAATTKLAQTLVG
ncbi:MAG: acyl-CoA synthetase [Myxococcota bacterium]